MREKQVTLILNSVNSAVCLHLRFECQLRVYIIDLNDSCVFTFMSEYISAVCLHFNVSYLFTLMILALFWCENSNICYYTKITKNETILIIFNHYDGLFHGPFFFWKPIKLMQKWKVSGKFLPGPFTTITGQKLQVILKKG